MFYYFAFLVVDFIENIELKITLALWKHWLFKNNGKLFLRFTKPWFLVKTVFSAFPKRKVKCELISSPHVFTEKQFTFVFKYIFGNHACLFIVGFSNLKLWFWLEKYSSRENWEFGIGSFRESVWWAHFHRIYLLI